MPFSAPMDPWVSRRWGGGGGRAQSWPWPNLGKAWVLPAASQDQTMYLLRPKRCRL